MIMILASFKPILLSSVATEHFLESCVVVVPSKADPSFLQIEDCVILEEKEIPQ